MNKEKLMDTLAAALVIDNLVADMPAKGQGPVIEKSRKDYKNEILKQNQVIKSNIRELMREIHNNNE